MLASALSGLVLSSLQQQRQGGTDTEGKYRCANSREVLSSRRQDRGRAQSRADKRNTKGSGVPARSGDAQMREEFVADVIRMTDAPELPGASNEQGSHTATTVTLAAVQS